MLPVSLAFFLVSLKSGRLATRVGARLIMTCGLGLMGLGLLALSTISRAADIVLIEFAFLSIGIGLGLITPARCFRSLYRLLRRHTRARPPASSTRRE